MGVGAGGGGVLVVRRAALIAGRTQWMAAKAAITRLKGRVSVVRGGHRAPPALAGGLLAVRDKSRLVCVDLRAGK